ncbi:RidA family protein [Actinomadura sp. KC345]|uniref:RidA family protein n=1 Tax=Actinomadura sp. KC345 TaxID=2530371 RepID=UPI001052C27B|nr:RidA family protein [Actinomadura sp. KC345]TDC47381.1 RidA family protein [Actinomadura sp. KC345]
MSKISISSSNAPKVGFSEGTGPPLSQAIVHGDLIFCSGTGPLDPATRTIVSDDLAEQVRQTLTNLVAVVEAAGGTKDSILKCNCYLRDASQFPEFNKAYREFFDDCESFPARTTVNAPPHRAGVLVEVECTAAVVEAR